MRLARTSEITDLDMYTEPEEKTRQKWQIPGKY